MNKDIFGMQMPAAPAKQSQTVWTMKQKRCSAKLFKCCAAKLICLLAASSMLLVLKGLASNSCAEW